jgi:hypothetical protein
MKICINEKEPAIPVESFAHLDLLVSEAFAQANDQGFLSLILLKAGNGNELGVVVGGVETVLSFQYNHPETPYYASKGKSNHVEPIMTCYLLFNHHTEFLRKYVISCYDGLSGIYEFLETGELPPNCIEWEEV